MPLAFISYRWDDDAGTVKLIVDRLKARLPQWSIFYDHESIPLGQPFPDKYRKAVTTADVVLVMIGEKWLRHLQDRPEQPIDHVRTELTLALESGHDVLPLTLGKAKMPTTVDLEGFPELMNLSSQLAKAIRPMPDFERDLEELIAYLEAKSGEDIGTILAGNYKLTSKIGEGGMGIVYKARSHDPKRAVAVKLIKPGMDSKEVLARFDTERQALASMNHPNIAQVLDAGLTSGKRPYFVMEYVNGTSITKYCDEHKLKIKDRLGLFQQVCEAIQHAHQKLILHRDLKPSNVLVEVIDGKPVPKVIDFGLAKALGRSLTDKSMEERSVFLGTLEYASPEAALGQQREIDTRTDIYSLGVILYELLTGALPFSRDELRLVGHAAALHHLATADPPTPVKRLSSMKGLPEIAACRGLEPGALAKQVAGELEWIILRAMEKDRSRRYETANGFAADVQRYLTGEPVLAHPPSRLYLVRKFIKRNQGQVIAAGLVVGALVVGLAVSLWQMNRAIQAEGKALAAANAETRQRKEAEAVSGLLEGLYRDVNPSAQRKDAEDLRSVLATRLDLAATQLEKDFQGEPLTKARLQQALGEAQHGLGEAKKAVVLLEACLATRRAALGPDTLDADTLVCRVNLASALQDAGRLAEAVDLQEKTLDLMKKHLGPDDKLTLQAMNKLADGYLASGRQKEALALFEDVLVKAQARLGANDLLTILIKNNLAAVLRAMARYERAEILYKEVIAAQSEHLGSNHPETLAFKDNLSGLYSDLGRYSDSVKLSREVLDARIARLGPDHVATYRSRNNLALVLGKAGKAKEAIPLLELCLQHDKLHQGVNHPSTLSAMNNLASAYDEAGRYKDALPLFEQSYQVRKDKLGPSHPDTLTSMNNLAIGYIKVGRHADALPIQEELLKLRKEKLGVDHPDTLTSMDNLAGGYFRAGRAKEAVPLFEESLKRHTARLGPEHPDTLITKNNLAFIYNEVRRVKEAIPVLEEALKISKAKLGIDHPSTLTSMNNLASFYRKEKRWNDALPMFVDTLQLMRVKRGPSHPLTVLTMINLAGTYQESGEPKKAIPLFEEVLIQRRVNPGSDAPETLDSIIQLAQAYIAAGEKMPKAEALLREVLAIQETKTPDIWITFCTKSLIGRALLGQKKYPEAETLLLSGYEGMKQREKLIPPKRRNCLLDTLDRLIQLNSETNKPEEVKKWETEKTTLEARWKQEAKTAVPVKKP